MASRNVSDRTRLSDEQLQELMGLIKGADSVELKLTIPDDQHRATIANLDVDPVEAQPRQVFFFDTPDLALDASGVVVRARRIQGGKADTVVKLRPVVPDDISSDYRKDPLFKVEVDAMPGGFVASGSYKGKTTGAAVRDVVGVQRIHEICRTRSNFRGSTGVRCDDGTAARHRFEQWDAETFMQ